MKFETVEDHDLGMVFMCVEKIWPRAELHWPENLAWPNHALCRKFPITKVVGIPNNEVCGLNNFFDLATPWLSEVFFNITASAGQTMYFRINVIVQKL